MLRLALAFLVVAIVAAMFGFGTIAGTSVAIAKLLFFIFIIGFLITLILGMSTRRRVIS